MQGFFQKRRNSRAKIPRGSTPDINIDSPSNLVHQVHVDQNLNWSGLDPVKSFDLVSKLGEGAFGTVYKATLVSTEFSLAIKVIPLDHGQDISDVQAEIDILRQCKCPNIVSYFGSIHCKENMQFWVLMDLCELGSVRDWLDKFGTPWKEKQIAAVCLGAVKGLTYLHSQHIIHRDVKCANILIDLQGEVKIADFGVSGQFCSSWVSNAAVVGSPLWMAPEVIQKQDYNAKADIWSLGITALEIAEIHAPYYDCNPLRAMIMITRSVPPKLSTRKLWSTDFHSFLELCLRKNIADRTSAADLLKHPFVAKSRGNPDLQDIVNTCKKFIKKKEKNKGKQSISIAGIALNRDQGIVAPFDTSQYDSSSFSALLGQLRNSVTSTFSSVILRSVNIPEEYPQTVNRTLAWANRNSALSYFVNGARTIIDTVKIRTVNINKEKGDIKKTDGFYSSGSCVGALNRQKMTYFLLGFLLSTIFHIVYNILR